MWLFSKILKVILPPIANTAQLKGSPDVDMHWDMILKLLLQNDCAVLNCTVSTRVIRRRRPDDNKPELSCSMSLTSSYAMLRMLLHLYDTHSYRCPLIELCKSSTNCLRLIRCVLFSYIRIHSCYADHFIFIQSRGVSVFITHLRAGPREMFERGGIVKLLGEDAFYEDVGTAINYLARDATLLRY